MTSFKQADAWDHVTLLVSVHVDEQHRNHSNDGANPWRHSPRHERIHDSRLYIYNITCVKVLGTMRKPYNQRPFATIFRQNINDVMNY